MSLRMNVGVLCFLILHIIKVAGALSPATGVCVCMHVCWRVCLRACVSDPDAHAHMHLHTHARMHTSIHNSSGAK